MAHEQDVHLERSRVCSGRIEKGKYRVPGKHDDHVVHKSRGNRERS